MTMLSVTVPKADGERARLLIAKFGILDKHHRIIAREGEIEIPIMRELANHEMALLEELGGTIGQLSESIGRETFYDPMKDILANLDIPDELMEKIPQRWEFMGNVLVIKLDKEVQNYKSQIAEVYAGILNVKTVLWDTGGITGEFREPVHEILCGSDTITTHLENGIRYNFDAARLMFSSGNVDERIRMASVCKSGEILVDMFAGIGYFTLPMAVHSSPARVLAYEKNPLSFEYLKKNIELNDVGHVIEPHLADCQIAEEGIADRVVMGYVGTTHEFLPKAMRILKPDGGIIHYHETCPNALADERPRARVMEAASAEGREVNILQQRLIKSYSPGVGHFVLDVKINRVLTSLIGLDRGKADFKRDKEEKF